MFVLCWVSILPVCMIRPLQNAFSLIMVKNSRTGRNKVLTKIYDVLTVGYKIGGNEYQRLGYDPGYRRVPGLPRDLRSPSAISRNRWYVEIWPIPKLSVSSIVTEFLAVFSQEKNFKTGKKILARQMFELSTLAFLAQCCNRLSYRAVLIWLLL